MSVICLSAGQNTTDESPRQGKSESLFELFTLASKLPAYQAWLANTDYSSLTRVLLHKSGERAPFFSR
jgi:hypothetical protein